MLPDRDESPAKLGGDIRDELVALPDIVDIPIKRNDTTLRTSMPVTAIDLDDGHKCRYDKVVSVPQPEFSGTWEFPVVPKDDAESLKFRPNPELGVGLLMEGPSPALKLVRPDLGPLEGEYDTSGNLGLVLGGKGWMGSSAVGLGEQGSPRWSEGSSFQCLRNFLVDLRTGRWSNTKFLHRQGDVLPVRSRKLSHGTILV